MHVLIYAARKSQRKPGDESCICNLLMPHSRKDTTDLFRYLPTRFFPADRELLIKRVRLFEHPSEFETYADIIPLKDIWGCAAKTAKTCGWIFIWKECQIYATRAHQILKASIRGDANGPQAPQMTSMRVGSVHAVCGLDGAHACVSQQKLL